MQKQISIVVPVYNEEGNVEALHKEIKEMCEKAGYDYEIIFINDGSSDQTDEICRGLKPLKYIQFRKNFGQTAAMDAGIKASTKEFIVTLDGDGQNDPADIPILITAFAFGPAEGLLICAVVSLVQGITVSASSGVIGIVMHILSTGAFVLVAGNMYRREKTRKGALLSLVAGSLVMAGVMCILNLILTPIFMNTDFSVVKMMILPTILPFNLLKAGLNSAVTFVLYKKISNYLKMKTII